MRVRWTRTAAEDLEDIAEYLKQHHPRFMNSTVVQLYQLARSLKASPYRGRVGREDGTRELICTPLPYVITYRVTDHAAEILHIHHGAQNRQ